MALAARVVARELTSRPSLVFSSPWVRLPSATVTVVPVRTTAPAAVRCRQRHFFGSSARRTTRPFATEAAQQPAADLDFLNARLAFESKSTFEVLRAWAIFKICSIQPIVDNCEKLYTVALKVLGTTLVHGVVKQSFFGHFCAGIDDVDIVPRVEALRKQGVGAILDYAAEAKVEEQAVQKGGAVSTPGLTLGPELSASTKQAITYTSEAQADAHVVIFEAAVRAVRDTSPDGFAAVKISGLGDVRLLERVSTAITELDQFFRRMKTGDEYQPQNQKESDLRYDYQLSYEEFKVGWLHFFDADESAIKEEFDRIDKDLDGQVNFVEWNSRLSPEDVTRICASCKGGGKLTQAALNAQELQLLANLRERTRRIVKLAQDLGVRVMIDAEWIAVQPAINYLVLDLQREFNRKRPVVFGTYQAYLRRTVGKVQRDIVRSQRDGFILAAKVVRGAYMVSERERAKELGIQSPVWDSYEESEQCYHDCIHEMLHYMSDGLKGKAPGAELMAATHNRGSCQLVVRTMQELNIPKESGVYMAQLLGMADHITMVLGQSGYKAYKYVPYGPVDEVMPYLIRRTQENSTFLGSAGVQEERHLLAGEVRRRLFGK